MLSSASMALVEHSLCRLQTQRVWLAELQCLLQTGLVDRPHSK